jgi:hypothetical protein
MGLSRVRLTLVTEAIAEPLRPVVPAAAAPSIGLVARRWPGQLAGYVGEESPVEGAWVEEEKSSCSKRAILELLSCSNFKRFLLASSLCSMWYTGRQFNVANKRRQGAKVETHSDLVRGLEGGEVEEVVISVVRGERNQEQQGASGKDWPSLAIQQPGPRDSTNRPRQAFNINHHRSESAPAPISR